MDKNRVEFRVDPENRVVIAKINNCETDAIEIINNRFMPQVTSWEWLDYDFGSKLLMPQSFKVVVKCDKDDEFDPEVGKKLAMSRLIDKYHTSLNKRLFRFANMCDILADEMVNYFIKKKLFEDKY